MTTKGISTEEEGVPDVARSNELTLIYDVPKTVKQSYDYPPAKHDSESVSCVGNEPKMVDSGTSSDSTTIAKHKKEKCLRKQETVFSIDHSGYETMQPRKDSKGIVVPYLIVPLFDTTDENTENKEVRGAWSEHVYESIDIDKNDINQHNPEIKYTNIPEATPVAPPRPENTLKPYAKPSNVYEREPPSHTQTIPPPLPTSQPPSCNLRKTNATSPNQRRRPVHFFDESEIKNPVSNTRSENCRQILIKGIPAGLSVEDITDHVETDILAMENVIDNIRVYRPDQEVVVTLRNIRVAEEILGRAEVGEKFTLTDSVVVVMSYQQPLTDPSKAFIRGLSSKTTIDDISRYIESRCGHRPSSVIIGESPGTALASLEDSADLKQVQAENDLLQPSEKKKWFISAVERSRRIRVKAAAMDTTPETLKYYFENDEQSRGGITESIIYRNSFSDFIVTFENVKDAENVVKKENHTVNEVKLEVSIFYPCLDVSEECFARKPMPKRLHNLDKYMCRFLQHHQQYRRNLEESVKSHYGKVIWPPEKSNECSQIECDVDERDKAARDQIKDWEQNSASAVSEICRMLSVHYKYCALEILDELKTNIKAMEVCETDAISIFCEENRIVIAGEVKHVDDLFEKIKSMVSSKEQSLDSQGQQITKIMKLKRHEEELIRASSCLDRFKNLNTKLETHQIVFKGKKKTVDDLLLKVKEMVNSFPKQNVEGISRLASNLLQMKAARLYVEEKMAEAKVTGVIELFLDDNLQLFSTTDEELASAASILKSSLKSTPFKVKSTIQKLLQGKEGKRYLAKLEHDYNGKLLTKFHKDELSIVSLDSVHQEVMEHVKKYIDSQSDITELLPLDPGIFRYIFTYKQHEIGAIEQEYKKLSVEIDIIDKETRKGFMISGKKSKCKLAIVDLHATINTVIRSDHVVTWPMFDTFLRSSEGIDVINEIELAEKCVLTVSTGDRLLSISEKCNSTLASCRIGQCEIKVTEGDITEIDVEYIVNPTNSALENKRGLGRTLVDKGGFSIQKDCKDHIQGFSSLKDGDFFVGKQGSLRCKGIIHIVLPNWSGDCDKEESILHDAVITCLTEADRRKSSSIALPPIGVGQFCYPDKKVAEILIKAIKEYLVQNGAQTLLRQVYMCDLEGKMLNLFVETLDKGFGHTTIHTPERFERDQTDSSQEDKAGECFIWKQTEIITGTLASQDVDVIVNSTNANLNPRVGTLFRTLLKEGGDEIAKECKAKYSNGIIFGQVAQTSGGALKCKAIFHGVLMSWKQGPDHAEAILKSFVRNCLLTANKKRYASIAFPVLGTGNLGFPADTVADLMLETIHTFEKDVPNSSLKTVRIVILPTDEHSIKAFEEGKLRYGNKRHRSKTADVSSRQSCQLSSVFIENKASFTTTIGHVTLRIEHGDLTKSTTSVIVNSVVESLNLNTGKISRAILKDGGMSIQHEANENKKTFREEGLVMTNSGQLLCQKVIHVKAKNSVPGWKRVVSKCLEEVEKSGLNSVSFPALGTGGKGFTANQIARAMVEALQEYVHGGSYQGNLKSVEIIVYDKDMEEKFTKEIKSTLAPSPRKSFFKKIMDRKPSDETSNRRVIHIYSESTECDENVIGRLKDVHKSINISVPEAVLAKLSELQISALKQTGQTHGVEVCVSRDCFILSGYRPEALQTVKDKVHHAINGFTNGTTNGGMKL